MRALALFFGELWPQPKTHDSLRCGAGLSVGPIYRRERGRRAGLEHPEARPNGLWHLLFIAGPERDQLAYFAPRRINENAPWFKPALKAAGIREFKGHDIRHTFASWLVQYGVPLDRVSKLLGHKSLSMTMRYPGIAPQ